MNQDLILNLALPITLFCIMFSMGINLTLADFRLLMQKPSSVFSGLAAQMLILPLLAFMLLTPLQLSPEIFAGFMILALSPGGTTSNMFSYLAGGDLALSVTLTALVSLITPVSIPLIASWILAAQLETAHIQLPFWMTMLKLIVVTLIPLSLGMLLHSYKPAFCQRNNNLLTRTPIIMLLLVITGIIHQNWGNMPYFLQQTGVPALLLASVALLVAYILAHSLKQNEKTARTIAIETSIQNGGTAILITGSILHNPAMTIAPVMYGILMLIPVSLFVYLINYYHPTMNA